jgi:polyisoprenoid-binding protein YceI
MTSQAARDLAPTSIPAGTWSVVPDASTASFTVRDKLMFTVHGTIPVRSGSVVLGAEGEVTRASVQLDVTGIATGNSHRDKDLRKPAFFDVDEHPELVVRATSTTAGSSGWQLTATLSARGASCPLDLEVTPTAWEDQRIRVQATGRLDRKGLGMKVPTFIVGRYVDVQVDAVFERP